jgi:hypothetical protein
MRHPFLRSAGSELKDPNFKNVTLLLHGDGTNGGQNNTFVDGSTNNFTITRNGNTTQGTFSPYGDNWSNYFDGTGDYLSIANNSAFDFGTGDFTIECWFYIFGNSSLNASSSRLAALCTALPTGGATTTGYELVVLGNSTTTGTGLEFKSSVSGTSYSIVYNGTISQATWHHIAVVRSGTLTSIYFNGTSVASGTLGNQNVSNSTHPLFVGASRYATYLHYLNGYTSNLRILKGTAQYTAAFTPPTAPLTAITNTSLLTCQSNRFCDASTNNFTITRNGDVSVQRFSPFSPTAAYAAGTIGGSGYFDGAGDSLTVADNAAFDIGSGAFTLEAFVYLNALTNFGLIIGQWGTGGNNAYVLRQQNSILAPEFIYTTNGTTEVIGARASTALQVRTWTHLAVVRDDSSTLSLFVNGSRAATNSSFTAAIFNSSLNMRVGGEAGVSFTNGYICDARLVKGTAVYDPTQTSITVPTAPLTAITNTSLLLNFQNAAILDNAMMAVPETVGNAQIDTSVKKPEFGTGSMKFDGTGDYLTVPNNVAFNFGTGDFTIEAWVYVAGNSSLNNSTQRAAGVIASFPTTTQTLTNSWALTISGSGTTTGTGIGFSSWQSGSQSLLSATVTMSQTSWNHIAVARSGTTTKLFLNGTEVASGTLSNQTVNSGQNLAIGRTGYPGYIEELNGYIDDLRVTNGVARYTANFTAPAAPFPNL